MLILLQERLIEASLQMLALLPYQISHFITAPGPHRGDGGDSGLVAVTVTRGGGGGSAVQPVAGVRAASSALGGRALPHAAAAALAPEGLLVGPRGHGVEPLHEE